MNTVSACNLAIATIIKLRGDWSFLEYVSQSYIAAIFQQEPAESNLLFGLPEPMCTTRQTCLT